MSAHCACLSWLFTIEYTKWINAQIVHPMQTVIVKPNELELALCHLLHMSVYESHQSPAYLAATLSYGIIRGHPFMDGNKCTGSSPHFKLIVQWTSHSAWQRSSWRMNTFMLWVYWA